MSVSHVIKANLEAADILFNEHDRLLAEYVALPWWAFIREHRLLKQMHVILTTVDELIRDNDRLIREETK